MPARRPRSRDSSSAGANRLKSRRWCFTLHLRDGEGVEAGVPDEKHDAGAGLGSQVERSRGVQRSSVAGPQESDSEAEIPYELMSPYSRREVERRRLSSARSQEGEEGVSSQVHSRLGEPPSSPVPGVSRLPSVSSAAGVDGEGEWTFLQPQPSVLRSLLQDCKQILYYIFQLEQCPETSRYHFQGYLRFTGPKALSYVKSVFGDYSHVHCESAKGTEEQNIAYCSKEESRVSGPWEFGERAQQGKRSDIDTAREIVGNGGGMRGIIAEVGSYQAMRAGQLMLCYVEPGRDASIPKVVRWYHGRTGTGKTRAAVEEFPDAWVSTQDLKWWDGYDAHKVVIVDDFRKGHCRFSDLLRYLDRYEVKVAVKGGFRQLLADIIIITCPWAPDVLYSNREGEDVAQLTRRISEVRLFGGEPSEPPKDFPSASARHFRSS